MRLRCRTCDAWVDTAREPMKLIQALELLICEACFQRYREAESPTAHTLQLLRRMTR